MAETKEKKPEGREEVNELIKEYVDGVRGFRENARLRDKVVGMLRKEAGEKEFDKAGETREELHAELWELLQLRKNLNTMISWELKWFGRKNDFDIAQPIITGKPGYEADLVEFQGKKFFRLKFDGSIWRTEEPVLVELQESLEKVRMGIELVKAKLDEVEGATSSA